MNPRITIALAAERQRDLERAAGCCTPIAEPRRAVAGHRRAIRRRFREHLSGRRPALAEPGACCA